MVSPLPRLVRCYLSLHLDGYFPYGALKRNHSFVPISFKKSENKACSQKKSACYKKLYTSLDKWGKLLWFNIQVFLKSRMFPEIKLSAQAPEGIWISESQSITWHVISSGESLSHVWLFATPWTAVRQASLSFTNSRSLVRCHGSSLFRDRQTLAEVLHRISESIIYRAHGQAGNLRTSSRTLSSHIQWNSHIGCPFLSVPQKLVEMNV